MAKKKDFVKVEETTVPSTPESDASVENASSKAKAGIKAEEPQNQADIPVKILGYFKRHPELKCVYVDKLGGTYHEGVNQMFAKDATLYQNPYFNH